MRLASLSTLGLFAMVSRHAQAAPGSDIRHIVVSVAATNDEWTTTGLTINAGDIMIVRAPGYVVVGAFAGERDAAGFARNGTAAGPTGSLEYKIGVSAGKPAGKYNVHVVEESGELKFRVRDTDYRDNSGQFVVDVIILPPSAIPPVPGGDASTADEPSRIAVIATKSFLRELVSSMEGYFADHSRYTNRFADLRNIQVPAGVTLKSLVAPANGGSWTATASHLRLPSVVCGIGINTTNPVSVAAAEGEPACK